MGFLSIFGNRKIKEALREGATIIDTRIASEFDQGKIRTSINIPLDRIDINLQRIRHMRRPIIICGASELEAEQGLSMLRANGITDNIYNGGNWTKLLKIIRSL
jgi:rhodanese-related sulfurtransferase